MFIASVRKYLGNYLVNLGGADAIVFTAGIGENTPKMRKAITENCEFLGIKIDDEKNNNAIRGAQGEISTDDSKIKVFVIPTNEELMIAKETAELV